MANRVAIFIDGAYLESVLRKEFQNTRISYQQLPSLLAGESDILRTYYYNCPPYQSRHPAEEESRRYASYMRFVAALERLPRFSVRLGQLAHRGSDSTGKPIFVQKRVDILLGVDLVQLAAKQTIQEAVLVAGDSDFIPAVTAAKSEGVLVRLFHGEQPHNELWRECDERTQFSEPMISTIAISSV